VLPTYGQAMGPSVGVDMPEGWEEFLDRRTNDKYYHNRITKVTQWERPVATQNFSGGRFKKRERSQSPAVARRAPKTSSGASPRGSSSQKEEARPAQALAKVDEHTPVAGSSAEGRDDAKESSGDLVRGKDTSVETVLTSTTGTLLTADRESSAQVPYVIRAYVNQASANERRIGGSFISTRGLVEIKDRMGRINAEQVRITAEQRHTMTRLENTATTRPYLLTKAELKANEFPGFNRLPATVPPGFIRFAAPRGGGGGGAMLAAGGWLLERKGKRTLVRQPSGRRSHVLNAPKPLKSELVKTQTMAPRAL